MKIYEIINEAKDTHCSDKCCGADVKREDCKCPPTCKHCNCNAPNVSESIDKDFFHKSVENGKFMKHKLGGLNDPATLYLHDLDNKSSDGKSPMLVTFADQAAAEEARNQYGGKIIRSGMGTFRIIKDSNDLDETATAGGTSAGSIASVSSVPGATRKIKKKGKYGAPKAPQATNPDGTAKNAQDMATNLMGGAATRR